MLILLHFTTFQQQKTSSIINRNSYNSLSLWTMGQCMGNLQALIASQTSNQEYVHSNSIKWRFDEVWGLKVSKYLHDRFDVNSLESINSRGLPEADLCVYICDFLMVFFYNIDQNHWWYIYEIKREAFLWRGDCSSGVIQFAVLLPRDSIW